MTKHNTLNSISNSKNWIVQKWSLKININTNIVYKCVYVESEEKKIGIDDLIYKAETDTDVENTKEGKVGWDE